MSLHEPLTCENHGWTSLDAGQHVRLLAPAIGSRSDGGPAQAPEKPAMSTPAKAGRDTGCKSLSVSNAAQRPAQVSTRYVSPLSKVIGAGWSVHNRRF